MMQNFKRFGQQKPAQPVKKKEDTCRVVVKKKKDGSIVKEIKGCTKEQMKVLSSMDNE